MASIDEVRVIEFANGQRIIGVLVRSAIEPGMSVSDETDGNLHDSLKPGGMIPHIKKAALIILRPGPGGQPDVAMAPWPMFARPDEHAAYPLPGSQIMTFYKPDAGIFNAYNQMFGGGLVIAGPSTKLPPLRLS